jgi:hypothetical protein
MVSKIPLAEWHVLELAVDVHETPHLIGSMLFNLLDKAGYTPDEVQAIASAISRSAK